MLKFNKTVLAKSLTVVLAVLLFFGDTGVYSREGTDSRFSAACAFFRAGDYSSAVTILEQIIDPGEKPGAELRAKSLLLLTACFDNLRDKEKSQEYLRELKEMIDNKAIAEVPEISGIDPGILSGYLQSIESSNYFNFKKPLEVSEVLKQKMIHAPRKSIEKKEREKKKRKFPWLIAVGAVVVIGTAAVLLFSIKKKKEIPDYMEIEWVQIPAGEFLMGDNFNEGDEDELPVHPVYLDEYYISKFEVTIEQYNYFCRQRGKKEHSYLYSPGETYRSQNFLPNCPVFSITWQDAHDYCEWLSVTTGQEIHLPTEAQWEKAARGTGQKRFPWGNSEPDCEKANFLDCPDNYVYEVYAVDSLPAGVSPYGVYHMAGNVWEWCADWYDPLYYSVSAEENPRGPANGTFHVLRGGSAVDTSAALRTSNRLEGNIDTAAEYVGFRIVKEVSVIKR